jgi:AcrR family transcriptional regulator
VCAGLGILFGAGVFVRLRVDLCRGYVIAVSLQSPTGADIATPAIDSANSVVSVPTSTYDLRVETRDRLIESAGALLWERGYTGTSPRAIQERAGAGQGSMYHHFTGKPDLALAAMQRGADELRAEVQVQLATESTALEKIAAYLHPEREVLRGCRVGRLVQDPDIVANAQLRRPLQETFDWLCGRLAEVVTEGQRNGEIAESLDPVEVAATIAAVLQGGYVLARAAQSLEPFEHAINGALALLAAGRITRKRSRNNAVGPN